MTEPVPVKHRRKTPKPFEIRDIHRDICAIVLKHPNIGEYDINLELNGDAGDFWTLLETTAQVWRLYAAGYLDKGFTANDRTMELFDRVVP